MFAINFRRFAFGYAGPAVVLMLTALPSALWADSLFTFGAGEPTGTDHSNTSDFTIGYEFVPTTPLAVAAVGAYAVDNSSAGFTTADLTGLLFAQDPSTSAWALIDKVLIPTGTAVDSSNFAYAPLNTVLNVDTHYVVADYLGTPTSTTAGPTSYSAGDMGVSPGNLFDATFIQNRYSAGSLGGPVPYAFPTNNNPNTDELLGGNLLVTAVPEPSSVLMTGMAAAIALGWSVATTARRRRG